MYVNKTNFYSSYSNILVISQIEYEKFSIGSPILQTKNYFEDINLYSDRQVEIFYVNVNSIKQTSV